MDLNFVYIYIVLSYDYAKYITYDINNVIKKIILIVYVY